MDAANRCPRVREALGHVAKFAQQTAAAEGETSAMALFTSTSSKLRWVSAEISFLRAPETNRVPFLFKVPHAVHDKSQVCVVTPAPQRKYKDALDEDPVANVTKIIDEVKLNGKFSDVVGRRALAKSFDVFFVHNGLSAFPKLLTGEFLTRQTPVWMDGGRGTFSEQLRSTMQTVVCPRRGFDNTSVVIGHAGMTVSELEENVVALVNQLVEKLTGNWEDVLSIRVAAANADGKRAALPVYAHDFSESHSLPAAGAAPAKKAAAAKGAKATPAKATPAKKERAAEAEEPSKKKARKSSTA